MTLERLIGEMCIRDSFGTACNVSGDNAIGVIVETIYQKFINKSLSLIHILMKLVAEGIKAKDIVTMKSFENAIMVHAAISGSTNARCV